MPSSDKKTKYEKRFYIENYFPPKIEKIYAETNSVGQYEKFELNVVLDLKNIYHNPYDAEEIDLSAVFTSPKGEIFKIPGFIYQGFSLSPSEVLKEYPKPVWKIRFSPNQKGKWSYQLKVKNPQTKYSSKVLSFKCVASRNPGFIRVNKKDRRYFQFDSGEIFYARGENLCWIEPDDPFDFNDYFIRLKESCQNWIRVWNCPWHIITEWSEPRAKGLGRYSQRDSWKFDQMLELAARYGIYLQKVFNFHGMFIPGDEWENNPYNKNLGGPGHKPTDFFSNEEAKSLFKRKLRYAIARWGYSTNILAWELFNEVDLVNNVDHDEVAVWHREMAHYLKQADPFKHLITTSFARPTAGDKTWKLKDIDYTQVHDYVNDVITLINSLSKFRRKYNKPCLVGEIAGEITSMQAEARDKRGIRLHNSLWTSLMSPLAGTAMYWWWDGHIRHNNLYYHFKAVGEFVRGINWPNLHLDSVNAEVEVKDEDRGDVVISPILDWEPSTGSKFNIGPNGFIKSEGILSKYFQGPYHSEWRIIPTFNVTYREDGIFSIYIFQSSWLGAKLKIILDGKIAFAKKFPPAAKHTLINQEYRIKIPAGRHIIKIVNDGKDWINVNRIKFSNNSAPRLRMVGLQNNKFAILWCVNRQSTTENYLEHHFTIRPVKEAKVKISGLVKGNYKVEYWDPFFSAIVSSTRAVNVLL
ncbi:MAG: DUF5060 domain-containing protein [bacterium]